MTSTLTKKPTLSSMIAIITMIIAAVLSSISTESYVVENTIDYVDPTPEELLVNKLVHYMKENTNFLYRAIVNGEMKPAEVKIEWSKTINVNEAQLTYELAKIKWKNTTMNISMSAKALGNTIVYIHAVIEGDPENLASLSDASTKWFNSIVNTLRNLGYELNGTKDVVSIGNASYVQLWTIIKYKNLPILLSPPSNYAAIDITTKYKGEKVAKLYIDIRLGNLFKNTPKQTGEWKLTPEDAVKAAGLTTEKTTVQKFWFNTEKGLLPVYWVKYIDSNHYLHIYVVDATNGEVIAAWTTYVFGEDGGIIYSLSNYVKYIWLAIAGIGISIVIWHYLIKRRNK